jgi:hypothetical protein
MMIIGGITFLVAAVGVLRLFRPRGDRPVTRPEWVDIALAIAVTTGLTFGVMLITIGVASQFT